MHQPWLRSVSRSAAAPAGVGCVAAVRRAPRAVRPVKRRRPRQAGRWKTHNCAPDCRASRSAADCRPRNRRSIPGLYSVYQCAPARRLRLRNVRTCRVRSGPTRPWRALRPPPGWRGRYAQVDQRGQWGQVAIHAEQTVGDDQSSPRGGGVAQRRLQCVQILVRVDVDAPATGDSRRSGWRGSWHRSGSRRAVPPDWTAYRRWRRIRWGTRVRPQYPSKAAR